LGETADVIVLGMGTCGEDAALRLSAAGLEVVGIESQLIGGECPFWACLPTKSMVRSASLVKEAQRADGLVGKVTVEPDWSVIASRIRAEVTGGWDDAAGVARFEAKGGRFIRGRGKVTGPREVQVDGTTVTARRGVLVATGSQPVIPPVPGLSEVAYWTNHEAVEAETLPASLAILGGGAVGCELGQIFARFGVDVTIIEGHERLLAMEEPEASELVADGLREDGATIRNGVRAESVSGGDGPIAVHLSDGTTVAAERMLVATGRRADANSLGVNAAGATTHRGFVEVDGLMRAADGLWAIGDVTGKGLLTQVAEYQGMIAVEDILGGEPRPADYSALPRVTFTDPEVGGVGLTESQAREAGHDVRVTVKDLRSTFRGWLHATGNSGLIKLVADASRDRLLGATVVGPQAIEVLSFLTLAVHERTPLANLVNMIYGFPSFHGGVGEALGAYGRGIVRVLDPETAPMFDDPPDSAAS
jgi:pyruvate/2-oxoglutarate dehydrogenase complex dihydrolipoamide dehydrogenase (E3) component